MHFFGLGKAWNIRKREGRAAVHNLLGYRYLEEVGLLADGHDVVVAEVVHVRGVWADHDKGVLGLAWAS